MSQTSISLAIAAHNKDQFIFRTISSAYDWVDEVVFVYGSPTDNIISELKKFDTAHKIRFIFTDNPPMFHINKQKAIAACKKDWIIQLDTDEVVSPELKKEILATISAHTDGGTVAYWIPRLNYFLGRFLRKGGQYPDKTIRLYKNGVAHLPCKSVHEQVSVKGPIGELQSDLLHYPYPDFKTYLDKWAAYGALEGDTADVKSFRPTLGGILSNFFILPTWWFLKTYFRHRGYVDGFSGFVFSFFSGLRYPVAYIKLYERHLKAKKANL